MSPISSAVAQAAAQHADAFRNAQPFRHVVIDEFFEPAFARALLADFPRFEERYALNEMGAVGGKAVRERVRDLAEPYRALDDLIQGRAFLDFVSQVTGIPELLYDPDYVGGGTHENVHGQSLDPHVDFNYHPRTRLHRRLNLIVYLNPEWEADWGGALELHADPWRPKQNRVEAVLPLLNRCVIFETNEISWHGFQAIRLPEDRRSVSRKSFAIYLYTRERPPEETAPPHATIYVPEGMPRDLAQGDVLDGARVDELERRFEQFRGQLRFLYTREQRFERQERALVGALDEARSALRVPLQGYATQTSPPQGYWPDQWVAREFAFAFEPTRRSKRLTLELWAPDRLGGDQDLAIAVNGARLAEELRPGQRRRIELELPRADRVEVTVSASRGWCPKSDGGGDERELAWRLIAATLE